MASRPPVLVLVRERIASFTPRERVLIGIAAAVALIVLIYLLTRGGGDEEPVELTAAPTAPATVAPAPLPVVPVVAAPPPPMAPAAPVGDTSALSTIVLRGVSGGGPGGGAAIFALPSGGQRVVRMGREVIPGVLLQGIGIDYVIVSAGGSGMRLSLGKAGGVPVAAPLGAGASPTSAPRADVGQSAARQTMAYRAGLAPRRSGGRVTGFTIRPGATLPVLAQAGLQPGDVLLSVNGQALESEEKVLELANEIASSYSAEFEFERGGQRMRRTIEVNKR